MVEGGRHRYYTIKEANGKYYSEKRFSTGELALLRLVEQLKNVHDNSLVLLDEAEMALHPRIQVNLIKHLIEKAQEKKYNYFRIDTLASHHQIYGQKSYHHVE